MCFPGARLHDSDLTKTLAYAYAQSVPSHRGAAGTVLPAIQNFTHSVPCQNIRCLERFRIQQNSNKALQFIF